MRQRSGHGRKHHADWLCHSDPPEEASQLRPLLALSLIESETLTRLASRQVNLFSKLADSNERFDYPSLLAFESNLTLDILTNDDDWQQHQLKEGLCSPRHDL